MTKTNPATARPVAARTPVPGQRTKPACRRHDPTGRHPDNGHSSVQAGQQALEEPIALTRQIIGQVSGLYAWEPDDNSLHDALVRAGDIVLLQRTSTAANGELVAVLPAGHHTPLLRRVYFEDGQVRLQPEDRRQEPLLVEPGSFQIQGRVVAIVRQRPA